MRAARAHAAPRLRRPKYGRAPRGPTAKPSIDDDILFADEARPLLALGADVPGKRLRRPADRLGALLRELLAHLRHRQHGIQILIETLRYGARRACRNGDPAPRERFIAWH